MPDLDPRDEVGDAAGSLRAMVWLLSDAAECNPKGPFRFVGPADLANLLRPISDQLDRAAGALQDYVPRKPT